MKKNFLYLKKGTNTASKNIVYVLKDYDTTAKGTQVVGYGFDENGTLVLDYSVTFKELKQYKKVPLYQSRYLSFANYLLKAVKNCINLRRKKTFKYNTSSFTFNHLDVNYEENVGYSIFNDHNYNYSTDTYYIKRHHSGFFDTKKCLGLDCQLFFINGNFTVDKKYVKMPTRIIITHEVLNEKTNDLLLKLRQI